MVDSPPGWLCVLVAEAGVALTIVPRIRWVDIYEDQAVVSGTAMQVAAGLVPYRDFDSSIAPGSLFLYAGFFKLVGGTLVHERLLTAAAMLIGVFFVWRIGNRLLSPWWAAGTALIWGVWLPVFQEYSPYHFWSVAMLLGMAAALLSARVARRPRVAFVIAGLAAFGALVMLQASLPAVLGGLLVGRLVGKTWRSTVLPMLIAMAIPGIATLLVLGLLGALPGLFADTLVYNFQTFGPSQSVPFPWLPSLLRDTSFWEASIGALWAIPMHWLLAVVAPAAVTAATAIGLWRQRHHLETCPEWLLVGILAAGMYMATLLVHISDQNLWLSAPLSLVLVALRLGHMMRAGPARRLAAAAALVPIGAIYLTGLSPMVLGYAVVCHQDGSGFLRQVSTPYGSLCVTFDSASTVSDAVRFSAQHQDAVIAYLPTAPSLYEITGRVPTLPQMIVIQGVNSPQQLAQVESAMKSEPVEWVVYYKVDFSKDLPADRALQGGSASQFDQFLADNYVRDDQGSLVVYQLKP